MKALLDADFLVIGKKPVTWRFSPSADFKARETITKDNDGKRRVFTVIIVNHSNRRVR
jgi:hypothetical protein